MTLNRNEFIEGIDEYLLWLADEELASNTIATYKFALNKFVDWLSSDEVITKKSVMRYKEHLLSVSTSPNSVNLWIKALNKYLKYLGCDDLTVKPVKNQDAFNNESVLSKTDFKRLLRIAKRDNQEDLYYIIKILALTGIRIGELKFFTVEALEKNYVLVRNKGKIRKVPIRQDLRRELKNYAKKKNIKEGTLFPGPKNKMYSHSTIWRKMKKLAGKARVKQELIHAHSFRHLFTQVYNESFPGETLNLADILGHNDLKTTRKYTKLSVNQQKQMLENMKF